MIPNIWYVLPRVGLGGAEKHVINLAASLRGRGYDARIACLFEEGTLAPEAREKGIPLVCLDLKKGWGLATLVGIFRWIRSVRPSILHTYLFGFHVFAGLPARLCNVPIILSSRREIAHWKEGRHRWVENLGNLFVDRVICCSGAVRKWTLENEWIRPEKVLTIYNGVDIGRYAKPPEDPCAVRKTLGIPENAPLIGTVANFSSDKGYPYLLDAAQRVLLEQPSAHFLLVGSGPLYAAMKQKAAGIKGHERIIFSGTRHDIPGVLHAMDIFVLASVTEGLPNVLLEAMAAARPVVATSVGGIPELIESGKDGILVEPKDARGLAEALLALLKNPNKGVEMGLRAQEKIRKDFSLERMVDDYAKFGDSIRNSLFSWGEEDHLIL